MRRFASFLSVLSILYSVLLIFPGNARAESVFDRYFSGSYVSFELVDDTITDTEKFEAELGLRFNDGPFSAFLRATNDRPLIFQTDTFNIEKRGFNFELNDDWEFSGGHYNLVFGRGTVLNAVENRPLDRDAQLDGALIEGDLGFGDLTVFWGRHKSDAIEYYLSGINTTEGDPPDEIMGGRFDFDFDDFDIGFSYIDADQTRFGTQMSTVITEVDARWRIDNVTLYYETAWFSRTEPEGVEESFDGRSQLVEVLYGEPGFSLAGSWIRYDRAHFDYGIAPSLKRFDIDDSAARSDDETGYRFDLRLNPDSWDGNSLWISYSDLNGIENKDFPFQNYYIEWRSPQTDEWSGTVSYDHMEGFMLFYGAIEGTDESLRATLDGPFFGNGTFHLFGRVRSLSNEFENDDELELGFDWHVNNEVTVGLFRETSTREIEPPPPGLFDISPESPGQWNSAYIRWAPDPWSQFELAIGSQRGGFQCSGGTCAQLPPFKGSRFTYYRNF